MKRHKSRRGFRLAARLASLAYGVRLGQDIAPVQGFNDRLIGESYMKSATPK